MVYNRILVALGPFTKVTGPTVSYQYDQKQILVISGVTLPEYYEVDICNEGDTTTVTMVGTADGVLIPNAFLRTGRKVKAYVVLQGQDPGAVETRYEITLPVYVRPAREDIDPTAAEQQQIDSLIGALNDGVSRAETAAEAAEQAETDVGELVERAENAASNAETSASNASSSATNAANSASTATTKASQAASSAQSASQDASAANASAGSAAQSASSASESASASAGSASRAALAANAASESAGQAASSASSASGSASQAAGSAQSASGSAASASQSATNAANSASEASTQAGNAETKAGEAASSATAAGNAQSAAETAQGKAEDAQEAAESAAQSIASAAAQIAQNTQDISDLSANKQDAPEAEGTAGQVLGLDSNLAPVWVDQSDEGAPIIVNTASGDIATFADGADNRQIKKIIGTIVPQQDLHGYDNPWPAGGGKNLFDISQCNGSTGGITFSNDGRTITYSGTATSSGWKIVKNFNLPVGTYHLHLEGDGAWLKGYAGQGKDATVVVDDETVIYRLAMKTTEIGQTYSGAITNIQIEKGNEYSGWTPYANECPISGFTGCVVSGTGKNLFNENGADWKQSCYINASGGESENSNYKYSQAFTKVQPGHVYTLMIDKGTSKSVDCTLAYYDANKVFVDRISIFSSTTDTGKMGNTFTMPSDAVFVRLNVPRNDTTEIQLEESATATAYKPFGTVLPINWQTEAGTIYGGTVTLNEDGSADVVAEFAKRTISSISGSFGATNKGYAYYITLTGTNHTVPYAKQGNMRSNLFSYYPSSRADAPLYSYGGKDGADTTLFFILPSTITTVADANAWFASNPTDITVYLATPQTYHFDNVGELYTYLGTNNVWIDTGSISKCDYPADTKLYIDNKIAAAIANALNS